MTGTVDIHALAGAYALDAVDDLERAAFERHLRDCASCAGEVAELRETAAWLAGPVAAPAPARLREAVLGEVGRTPQERGRHGAAGGGRADRTRLRRWAVSGVAAAVLAAGVGVGTWAVTEQHFSTEQARVDAVLAAADARLVRKDMGGGRVTLVVSPSRNAAVAVLDGLASPGAGKTYQLWMIGNVARSVGLAPSGTGRYYISGLSDKFGVSREPARGSATPTDVVDTLNVR